MRKTKKKILKKNKQMRFEELVFKTRSCRKFDENHQIDEGLLKSLVGFARLSASAANRQPLKYLIYNSPADCERIFPAVAWAAYLKDWDGPEPGQRPSGYIIILGDKTITESFGVDHGIAAQSIMLGATEAGLGGCMIASIKREMLRTELKIPDQFDILLILAFGRPAETIVIEDIKNGDVRYWRDVNNNHHVPKRPLDELILKL
jgi:nitroreductase